MKPMLLALVLAVACAGGAAAADLPFADSALIGVWDGATCAAGHQFGPDPAQDYGIYFRRHYVFGQSRWIGHYTMYEDAACVRPLFDVRWSGSYKLLGTAPRVPTARAGDFEFETVHLTVQTPALLDKAQACGDHPWEVGVQQDISKAGCLSLSPFLASASAYPLDHDIVEVKDERLLPGFRNPQMGRPEGRPTRLQAPEIAAIRR